jgi:hypothetical protein
MFEVGIQSSRLPVVPAHSYVWEDCPAPTALLDEVYSATAVNNTLNLVFFGLDITCT